MSKRVLVIDDERDIREVAQASLEVVGGWDVVVAASGEEGLEKAASERLDAILLDVMMPGVDGPETLHRLKASTATAEIPVIFLTAKVQVGDQRRFADLPVRGVITKPFDPVTLPQRLATLLRAD